jgi:hypothetical protein
VRSQNTQAEPKAERFGRARRQPSPAKPRSLARPSHRLAVPRTPYTTIRSNGTRNRSRSSSAAFSASGSASASPVTNTTSVAG